MTDRTQFADLVRSQREKLNLSYRTLSEKCRDPETGEGVSYGWLHRLETGKPVVPPEMPLLRALSVGLQLPLPRLQEAAGAQFFGMDFDQRYSVDALELAELAGRLTAEQRDALIGLLDALLPQTRP